MKETRDQVEACATEVRVWLPELIDRHTPLVVLAALSEHVGGALYLCQRNGACTRAEARAVLRELEKMVFEDDEDD